MKFRNATFCPETDDEYPICRDVNICFGLLKITRTVELEENIEIDNIPNNKV